MSKSKILMCAVALAALPVSQASAYVVDVFTGVAPSLAAANAAIAGGSPAFSQVASIIEYDDLGDGTQGHFAINNPFPGGVSSNFAVHVTGTFLIGTAGTFTFGINHDDGAGLTIDGTLVATADFLTDNIDTTITSAFAAGLHSVDIVFFEFGGGASLEFFNLQGGVFSLVAAAPEPGILSLVGLGLLGMGFGVRRRVN